MAQPEASEMMSHRASLVEHPFGTLKCRAGYRHFLLRGFTKVRGEWSLMALCYNFTRVLSILGLENFVARIAEALLSSQNALADALDRLQFALETLLDANRAIGPSCRSKLALLS